jgi:hypothetical protein
MEETWEIWFPHAAATGLPFCRSRVDGGAAGERVLVHAAPPVLDVTVRDADGAVVASGSGLERGAAGPMSFLVRRGGTVTLEDGWPTEDDLGRLVLLPGGEAAVLTAWWHAEDESEWRWSVELYNHT